jgi:hypothetical protein
MTRYLPTLEINLNAAREVWPHRAYMFSGDGWKLQETLVDIDRTRGIRSADDARCLYENTAARLNAEYGRGTVLYRASSAIA